MTESDTPDSDIPETAPAPEQAAEATVEPTAAVEAAEPEVADAAAAVEAPADEAAAPEAVVPDAGEGEPEADAETPETEVLAAPRHVDARNPVWTVGRRKASTARIRMFPGGGNFVINGKPLEEYFRLVNDQKDATAPLHIANVRKKYDVWINANGGGMTGQSGAISLGVARALAILEPASEQALRDANMMSRDARVKERKKYGRRGARRGFQFSKR